MEEQPPLLSQLHGRSSDRFSRFNHQQRNSTMQSSGRVSDLAARPMRSQGMPGMASIPQQPRALPGMSSPVDNKRLSQSSPGGYMQTNAPVDHGGYDQRAQQHSEVGAPSPQPVHSQAATSAPLPHDSKLRFQKGSLASGSKFMKKVPGGGSHGTMPTEIKSIAESKGYLLPGETKKGYQLDMRDARGVYDAYSQGIARNARALHNVINEEDQLSKQVFNLMLEVQMSAQPKGNMEVFASVYSGKLKRFISEEFFCAFASTGKFLPTQDRVTPSCIFTDYTLGEIIQDELYLILRVYLIKGLGGGKDTGGGKRSGSFGSASNLTKAGTKKPLYRRPCGVAILDLPPQAAKILMINTSKKIRTDQDLALYAPKEENDFPFLHQDIITGSRETKFILTNTSVNVSLSLWKGNTYSIQFPRRDDSQNVGMSAVFARVPTRSFSGSDSPKGSSRRTSSPRKTISSYGPSDAPTRIGIQNLKGIDASNKESKMMLDGTWLEPQPCPYGEIDTKQVSIIAKRGFQGLFRTGTEINSIIVTLEGAEDEKGWEKLGIKRKKAAKNILVRAQLCSDVTREPIPGAVGRGCGASSQRALSFESCVYYHHNTPYFQERFFVHLPVDPENYHLYLKFFHCPREEAMYPIGFTYMKFGDNAEIVENGHYKLPVLKYSKKSGKCTESSNYLAFDRKLVDDLSNGIFRISTEVASVAIARDTLVTGMLRFYNLERTGNPMITPAREVYQGLKKRKLDSVAKWIGGLLSATFCVIKNAAHQPLHHEAVLYLAYVCSQDTLLPPSNEELRQCLGYGTNLTSSAEDVQLQVRHHVISHVKYMIGKLGSAPDVQAAIVILKHWQFIISLPILESMSDSDPRWFDIYDFIRGGSLLYSVVMALVDMPTLEEHDRKLLSPRIHELLRTSSQLMRKVTSNLANATKPLFQSLQECMLTGLPKWLRIVSPLLTTAQCVSILRLFWEPLCSFNREKIVGERTSERYFECVASLMPLGLISQVGLRTQVLTTLIPTIKRFLTKSTFKIQIICVDILSRICPTLDGEGVAKNQLPDQSDILRQIDELNQRKKQAALNEDFVGAQQIKQKVEELQKSLDEEKKGMVDGTRLNSTFIKQISETVPLLNHLVHVFKTNQVNFDSQIPYSKQKVLAILSTCLISVFHLGTQNVKEAESPLSRAFKNANVDAVLLGLETLSDEKKNNHKNDPKLAMQAVLFQCTEVALGFMKQSCFDGYWVQLRLLELRFAVQVLREARSFWETHVDSTRSRFRRRFWQLANAILSTQDVEYGALPDTRVRFTCGYVDTLVANVLHDLRVTVMKLEPSKYVKMGDILLPSIVDIVRSRRQNVSNLGSEMLFQLMLRCWKAQESLLRLENITGAYVYRVVTDTCKPKKTRNASSMVDLRVEAPDIYRYEQVFTTRLKKDLDRQIEDGSINDLSFVSACDDFFQRTSLLFNNLYEVETTEKKATNEDRLVDVLLSIIVSFQTTGNKALFEIYANTLRELHESMRNFLELGYSLMLHADSLGWSNKTLKVIGSLPSETETTRHFGLLQKAKDIFSGVGFYGKCAEISGKLAESQRTTFYNIPALCDELKLQAQYYKNIIQADTIYPKYYLASYSGSTAFNEEVKNRSFIYRSWLSYREFCKKLQEKHPRAKIQKNTGDKFKDSGNQTEQMVGVTTVFTSSLQKVEGKQDSWDTSEMNERYKQYLKKTNVQAFTFKRTYAANAPEVTTLMRQHGTDNMGLGDEGSFVKSTLHPNMCVVQTFVLTEEAFPCARRRVPVVSRTNKLLSPLQAALVSINEKNEQILEATKQLALAQFSSAESKVGTSRLIEQLSQHLNGTIDTGAQEGIRGYIRSFLESDYLDKQPADGKTIVELKVQMKTQTKLLDKGLALFGEHCGEQLKPMHNHLLVMLAKLTKDVAVAIHSSDKRYLPRRQNTASLAASSASIMRSSVSFVT